MKGVSAVLDAVVQQRKSKQRHVGIAMVDQLHDLHCCFARRIAFFLVDQIDNLEVERQVGF